MAQRWVGLIRGINVGTARRIAMADLRAWVTRIGFEDVSTLLNSGNVVFSRPGSSTRSPALELERAIAEHAGFSAVVVALSEGDLGTVVRENALALPSRDPSRLQVAAVRTPAHLDRLAPLVNGTWGSEVLACGTVAAYLWCPDGVATSPLVQAVNKVLGDAVTMRNWSTVLRLHAAVGGMTQGPRLKAKGQTGIRKQGPRLKAKGQTGIRKQGPRLQAKGQTGIRKQGPRLQAKGQTGIRTQGPRLKAKGQTSGKARSRATASKVRR